ncbi:MAG: PqqD family protein [Anaerolineae bacterium]|nr:PqqD family protein [Anaerolineae bacterium]NUQ02844.1 PqqD family protein [Anaerolineae bacterium]
MIGLNTRIVASSNQISTEIPDETVILDVARGVYYGLDEVGTFIWNYVQSPQTVQAVVDALTTEYEVGQEQAAHDAVQLLNRLQEMGLLQVVA